MSAPPKAAMSATSRDAPAKQARTGTKRDGKGRFKKGVSGNPRGRLPGALTPEKLRAALADELPGILRTVLTMANDGDIGAIKLVLDRVLPTLRAAEAPVLLPGITGSMSEQGQTILNSMAEGGLSPSQAAQLLGALTAQAKIMEVDELERRLSKIEQKMEEDHGEH